MQYDVLLGMDLSRFLFLFSRFLSIVHGGIMRNCWNKEGTMMTLRNVSRGKENQLAKVSYNNML